MSVNEYGLILTTDFEKYLDTIKKLKDCIVIMAVKDTIGHFVGKGGYEALKRLGVRALDDSDDGKSNFWKGYVCVINDGVIVWEYLGKYNESVNKKAVVSEVDIEAFSSPYKRSNISSIIIEGQEYSTNKRGFNIVVYNKLRKCVIDSVNFDTHVKERPCFRDSRKINVNFLQCEKNTLKLRNINEVAASLKMDSILPTFIEESDKEIKQKIKVRFYFWGRYNLWNAMESVAKSFDEDERFDVLVVRHDNIEKNIIYLAQSGLKIIPLDKYKILEDKPDIGIYNINPTYMVDSRECGFNVITYVALTGGQFAEPDAYVWDITGNVEKYMDAIVVDENIYEVTTKSTMIDKTKWHSFGNAKFDCIYNHVVENRDKIPNEWDKLQDKSKIVLWAFDHNYSCNSVTFDLYIKHVIDFAASYTDIGFIIRPHVNYPMELISAGIWTRQDYERLIDYCTHTDNIIWDESKDYGCAYATADMVITDINCGITVSALALNKPLAVLHRFDGNNCESHFPQIHEGIYQIHNLNEFDDFIIDTDETHDTLKEKREMIISKYITHFDGKNGQRIKDFIVEEYYKKINVRQEKTED